MTKFESVPALTAEQIEEINLEMASRPTDIASATFLIGWAKDQFGNGLLADTSFGKDSALMWDGVARAERKVTFTFGDTGLMPQETYDQRDALTAIYPIQLEVATPDPIDFAELVEQRLWRSGRRSDKDRFLEVVKLEPLRKLDQRLGKRATLSAARADQTWDREGLNFVTQQNDGTHRVYPFLDWPEEQVDDYIDGHELPRNKLSILYGMGAVSYRNVVYYDGQIEIIDFDSCGRNSPDEQPVHIQ